MFGAVIEGMDVVRKIERGQTEEDKPVKDVIIKESSVEAVDVPFEVRKADMEWKLFVGPAAGNVLRLKEWQHQLEQL